MTWLGRQRVGRRYSSTHSQTRARRRWVVRSTLQLIYPGKDPCPFYRKLGGPRGRFGRHEKSRPHRNSIHGTSSPLYRLRFSMYTKHNSTNLRLLQDTHFVKYIYIYIYVFKLSLWVYSIKSSRADSRVRWLKQSDVSGTDIVSIIRIIIYHSPDDGYGVGFWRVGLLEPPDAAVSPRRFYWIC
jgi:hypothetical protein